jgi:hypothetical protein
MAMTCTYYDVDLDTDKVIAVVVANKRQVSKALLIGMTLLPFFLGGQLCVEHGACCGEGLHPVPRELRAEHPRHGHRQVNTVQGKVRCPVVQDSRKVIPSVREAHSKIEDKVGQDG